MNIAGIGPVFRFSLSEATRRAEQEDLLTVSPTRDIDSGRASSDRSERESGRRKAPTLRNQDAVVIEFQARETKEQNLQIAPSTDSGTGSNLEQNSEQARESEVQAVIAELKKRDRQVRSHEQAHKAVLGQYAAGGIQYQFTTGPDGNKYAIGGSVAVNLSEEGDPAETVRKMQTIRRAALAPQDPSSADRQVAGQASQIESKARAEVREEQQAEIEENREQEGEEDNSTLGLIPVNSDDENNPNRLNALAVYQRALETNEESQSLFATA